VVLQLEEAVRAGTTAFFKPKTAPAMLSGSSTEQDMKAKVQDALQVMASLHSQLEQVARAWRILLSSSVFGRFRRAHAHGGGSVPEGLNG